MTRLAPPLERYSIITKIIFAALLMLCVAVPACADDGIPDYYEYELITDENGVTTARLTDFIGDAEVVVMPSYVDGYMVTEVSDSLYDTQSAYLKKVTWAGTVPVVPAKMFGSYTALETVILSEGVTRIEIDRVYGYYAPYGAFYNCTSLTSVSLPNTLTYLGRNAFYGCSALTSITIPDSVEHLGMQAFYGCTAMTSATIGSGVTDMGAQVFENCTSLTDVTLKQGVGTLSSHIFMNTAVEKLVIPSSVVFSEFALDDMESLKYVEIYADTIPDGLFRLNTALETVILGEGVTRINDSDPWGAFEGCASLTSVSLPSTLAFIGNNAFYGCSALTSISIPDSVAHIGDYAFENCSAITAAIIGNGVAYMGSNVFANCTSLTDVTLKQGLTALGGHMFSGSSVEKLVIPSSVTNFSSFTCSGLEESLKHLEIYVDTIPDTTFYGFTVLETVILGEGVTKIENSRNYHNCGAFNNCTSLTSVSLPSTLIHLGDYAFYGCSALTTISIPDSVEYLGRAAFDSCSAMTSATIGNGVTSCGESAFANCANLTDVTLKQGLTTLGNYMFSDSGVEKLVIPSSVNNLSGSTCQDMEESLKHLEIYVDTIPERTFDYFTALETVILGEGVTKIANSTNYHNNGAFSSCTNLTSVSLPSTLIHLGDYAFYGCSALTSISIPDSVEYLGRAAFDSCSAMTSATIGNGVTTCGSDVFANCANLTDVTLKQGLTTLGSSMFSDSGVEKLIIPSSVTDISGKLSGMGKSLKHLEVYVDTIPYGSFSNFTALETVILGEGVTRIADGASTSGAFYKCTNLTTVSLPNTLTYIGQDAFKECDALTSITIPGSVATLIKHSFDGCDTLQSVILKPGVSSIGYCTFANCLALEYVYLPSTITSYSSSFPSSTTLIIPENTTTAATLAAAGRAYVTPTTLSLPADLASIEAEAFLGDAAEMVVIPASCTAIGSRAFADMPNLHYVQLPSGTVVAPDAFDGSPVLEFMTP